MELTFYCKEDTVLAVEMQAPENPTMRFGTRLRELRKAKNFSQRDLAAAVKVNFTYISKIENGKLDFGDYPSEDLIRKLAKALDADADELLLLAKKVPDSIRKRIMQRPDAFRKFANLDDETIDRLLEEIDEEE
jgi:transcriptional regulator with XRE-family HTH domain